MSRTRNAFTLIELLVVIAILMPALRGAREQVRAIQRGGNERILLLAWLMYNM